MALISDGFYEEAPRIHFSVDEQDGKTVVKSPSGHTWEGATTQEALAKANKDTRSGGFAKNYGAEQRTPRWLKDPYWGKGR